MSGRRMPRRTRVYDANYNIGEQYYKSAIDNLDKKYAAPSIVERLTATNRAKSFDKPSYKDADDDLFDARRRANKAIVEDSFYDSPRKTIKPITDIKDDFDEQIQNSLNRIRASKQLVNGMDNLDLEDTISSVKRKARLDFGDKLDSMDDDFLSAGTRRRALKAITHTDNLVDSASHHHSWRAESASEHVSAAANRARASKCRLDELESDMMERSEKQAARDRRQAHLKKFLIDNEADSEQTLQAVSRMTARAEKKIISY